MELPERKVILEITTGNGTKTIHDGLNVQFNITNSANAVGGEANIMIANLPMDEIINTTTLLSSFENVNKRKKIRLSAGYGDDVGVIFQGDVVHAEPISEPPDVWLQIEARVGYFDNTKVVTHTIKNKTPIKDIAQQAANWLGLSLKWMSTVNKMVNLFHVSGSANQIIQKLNDLGDIFAYSDSENLNIIDALNPNTGVTSTLSKSSGMVGIPKIDNNSVRVTMLLNHSLKLGQTINIKSDLIPSVNGSYWIFALTHSGALRENEFYTTACCRRKNAK